MTTDFYINVIGYVGSALCILAYTLNVQKKIHANHIVYHLLNIVGSAGLLTNTLYYRAIPSSIVSVIWISIAVYRIIVNKIESNEYNKA